MLPSSAPARQQAHALVDRMTPIQISALIELFEPSTLGAKASIMQAPFCDELPIDADEAGSVRALPPIKIDPPKYAPSSVHPSDLDTWPASMMSRSGGIRTPAA